VSDELATRIRYMCQECGFIWYENPDWPHYDKEELQKECRDCNEPAYAEKVDIQVCSDCGRVIHECDDETFDMDCDTYMRADALCRLLKDGTTPEYLEVEQYSLYDEGAIFAVNPGPKKFGTSPKEAKRLVAQLRESLRKCYGAESDKWDTTFFTAQQCIYERQSEELEKLDKERTRLEDDRWMSYAERAYSNVTTRIMRKAFDIRKPAHRKEARVGIAASDRRLFDVFCNKLDSVDKQITDLEEQRNKLNTYTTIMAEMQIVCPADLKIGTHEVVNTLYALTRICSNPAHAGAHALTVREAFDGKEPADRRETRTVNLGEYAVLTDDEADSAWKASLDSYIDDCLEIPEHVKPFFDRGAWIKKAKEDGRGHSLSCYDGEENTVEAYNGDTLYVYRQN